MSKGNLTRRGILQAGASVAASLSLPTIVNAQSLKALRPVSFQSDWIYGGPNAGFAIAKEKGYFADAGLDVTINQGKGSGNTAQIVASKAARIVQAAAGRPLYDFGARRGHGPQSGFLNARASYLAGFSGTSHVEAALRLGIPAVGTMAHAWVQAFGDEPRAFAAFAKLFPKATTLLVDTYDTAQGVRHAAAIEPPIQAIRIDSGDLVDESKAARASLDALNRPGVKILVSNDLDEFKISELLGQGAPIDAFGVGTELITSRDAPAISMVYKLVELDGAGRIKRSPGKRTYPMAKQVYRARSPDGKFARDRITGAGEVAEGEALLVPILRGGALIAELPRLDAIRERCRAQREALPDALRGVEAVASYPLEYSEALEAEASRLGLG